MINLSVSPDFLAYVLAGVVALAADWLPGVRPWFERLGESQKRGVMAGVLAGVVLMIYGGVCAGVFSAGVACDRAGLAALLQVYLVSIGINQGVHLIGKPASPAVGKIRVL